MKPALDAVKEYLAAKRIRYEDTPPGSVRFSLLIPTPGAPEMPNRLISCAVIMPGNGRMIRLSAAVMAMELSDELLETVASYFMKYQSRHLKAGRILLHDDGAVFYAQTQFLCSGGTLDGNSVASMVTTAIVEIAAIFMVNEEFLRILPAMHAQRFGVA